ncbi:hypothetical protein [Humibacter albus]|uniref:hypothetical protein n=1 Tax=Humibacter albus TaxID=427754 RepID=UPI0012FA6345|nr:hypothetical protein [Humibacter albus]
MTERQVQVASGERIGVTVLGDAASSRWVLFCHPSPGAGGFDPDPRITQRSTLSFISLDRPGYAASEAWLIPPQASPQRWAADAGEFLAQCRTDAESIGHSAYRDLAVLGWREGCVFAAAMAAAVGDVLAAAVFVEPMTLREAARDLRDDDVWRVERILPPAAHDEVPGLSSRVERMLAAARTQGEAGLDADRAAVKQRVLNESLDAIRAPSLILARDTKKGKRSARAYARHLAQARVAVTDAAVPIATHWARIVRYLERDHSPGAPER